MYRKGSILDLLNQIRRPIRTFVLYLVILLAILIYYWWKWHTFTNFVVAIDHHSQFMQDFVGHYYPMGKQILHDPKPVAGYPYSAFFALLLAPIGSLPLLPAMVIWGAIQLACLLVLCIVSVRGLLKLSPIGMILYIGLCATSFPILHNIKWGQVSVLITVCIIATFYAYKERKPILSGVLLAFSSAIKYYPILFLAYFILKRDARVCLSFFLSAFIFYFVLPASVLGPSQWLAFEKSTIEAARHLGVNDPNSQYIMHVGLRWFKYIFSRPANDTIAQMLVIGGYVIVLSSIGLVWLLQRRKYGDECALSMAVLFLSLPFVIRTSWPHYFAYLPFCQIALFSHCTSYLHASDFSPLEGKTVFVLSVFSILLSSVFVFNCFPHWWVYNSYGMLFLANLLLLVGMYAIIMQGNGLVNKGTDRTVKLVPRWWR